MLLLISLISKIHSQSTPCNSFPKIFGGSSSPTNLLQLDVFNDYMAIAGNTVDSSLVGFSITGYVPFLALLSVSKGGFYHWAKALTNAKSQNSFSGV